MNGFVPTQAPDNEPDIVNIDFYIDISPSACRDAIRLEQSITPERLRMALVESIKRVNNELNGWKQTQLDAGINTLNDVPADHIDDESVHISSYKSAVYYFAKADLLEQYRDYDSSATGVQRAEDKDDTADEYRRKGQLAVRDILGKPHTTVELI
jgi:hypothetical protein